MKKHLLGLSSASCSREQETDYDWEADYREMNT